MAGIYAQDGDGGSYDEEKPTWDDDINIEDIVSPPPFPSKGKKSKKGRKKGKTTGDNDEDYGMGEGDETYGEGEEWDGTEEMRKKKLQEYMDSLLELEFNDVVSATRLQYDRVSPSSPIGRWNPHEVQIRLLRASDVRSDGRGDSHG